MHRNYQIEQRYTTKDFLIAHKNYYKENDKFNINLPIRPTVTYNKMNVHDSCE